MKSENDNGTDNGFDNADDNDLDAMTSDLQDEPAVHPSPERGPRLLVAVIIAAVIGILAYSATGLIVNTKRSSESTADLVKRLVEIQARIEDCTTRSGKCYQENQAATGEAIQAILNGIQGQVTPHRLRNEAENLCNVVSLIEVTLNVQGRLPIDVNVVLDHYRNCVLENSGGTEPPPLPPNPYPGTTSTTSK